MNPQEEIEEIFANYTEEELRAILANIGGVVERISVLFRELEQAIPDWVRVACEVGKAFTQQAESWEFPTLPRDEAVYLMNVIAGYEDWDESRLTEGEQDMENAIDT